MRALTDSRQFWIGELPVCWRVLRGKDLFAKCSLPVHESDEVVTCFRDGQTTLRKNRREEGFTFAIQEHGYQGVRKGHLVVHAMDAFAGAIGVSDSNGKCSPVYSVCRSKGPAFLPFFVYYLRDLADIGYIQSVAKGIRERSTDFRFTEIARTYFAVPPLDEQQRIAAWLFVQTSRIDKRLGMLGSKRNLLNDLRKSVVNEAIVKGVDPKVPCVCKDSFFFPALPGHWGLEKFKRRVLFREGPGIMAVDFEETGTPLLRIGNITPGRITMDGCNYVQPEKAKTKWKHFQLRLGDLVISASASVGIVSEAGEDAVGAIPYTGLIILRPTPGLHKGYLKHFVVSGSFLAQIADHQKGSTIQHYGPTHLKQMLIPVPPFNEQERIAEFLDLKTAQIDKQLSLIERLEALLIEIRKALIHEAVTGKIDLSTYIPPVVAAAELVA